MLDASIEHWKNMDKGLNESIQLFTIVRDKAVKDHKDSNIELSLVRSTMKASTSEISALSAKVNALFQQSKSLTQRLECLLNQRSWLTQIVRSDHRRRCVLKGNYYITHKN